jgi:hypothetical protein
MQKGAGPKYFFDDHGPCRNFRKLLENIALAVGEPDQNRG